MIEIVKNTKIKFLSARKFAYIFSICLVSLGLFAIYRISAGKANMGLDFTGGISLQIKFSEHVTTDKIRAVMDKLGYNASLQKVGVETENIYLIRAMLKDSSTAGSEEITKALKKELNDENLEILEENVIGPVVSAQLKQKALYAVFFAAIGILVYIWIRFQFKFAVAATIATIHDVLTILGIMVLLGKEVDILMITALMTIAGYSLTDMVVVFDRIRENMRNILKEPFESIINRSINEVLGRTINTSLTTILVSVSLYLFGGDVLHNFALAITLGIIVGTYSSWFVASAIIFDWDNYEKKRKLAAGANVR
ncbi:MAG TPA: protein translocase subunit SecF [Candidatus Goldiibacteriota bacterium]|nr:protein translocase subunit SecF [Candidatus Goldiibacteriota bacterium]